MNKTIHNPELIKAVDTIIGLPSGPARWGAAISLWLNKGELINTPAGAMTAREYNDLQIRHNAMLRDTNLNKFAEIKGGGMRQSLAIPEGAWTFVKLCDPSAFNANGGNNEDIGRNLKRFMKAFPQYVVGID